MTVGAFGLHLSSPICQLATLTEQDVLPTIPFPFSLGPLCVTIIIVFVKIKYSASASIETHP